MLPFTNRVKVAWNKILIYHIHNFTSAYHHCLKKRTKIESILLIQVTKLKLNTYSH